MKPRGRPLHGVWGMKAERRTSLVVQWLGLHVSTAEGLRLISGKGTKISQVVKCGQNKYTLFLGFPCGSAGKESACNAGDPGSIPRLGRSPAEGKGCPLQYSGLENSKDCIVHGVTKSRTQLSNFPFLLFYIFLKNELTGAEEWGP